MGTFGKYIVSGCLHLLLFISLYGCSTASEEAMPQHYSYAIVKEYRHDPSAFTQGLVWEGGTVFEGTGLYGRSSLRRVDLETGRVEQQINLEKQFFGEGITVFQDKIVQLTWKNKIIFVRNKVTFRLLDTFPYARQGWGITHDGKYLIASDGSAQVVFLDPETMAELRQITVHDGDKRIARLNELEFIKGKLFANIYKSDKIVIINPQSGVVEGWLDLSSLRAQLEPIQKAGVLNGIMYDKAGDRLFVTGKFWPKLFEIRLIPEIH